ncbi:MAG: DUF2442 domain-containing protein [Caulobacteraceae bacterium]
MSTSTSEPTAVSFTEDDFTVSLDDGRSVTVPLAWFPRLMGATAEQLQDHFLSPDGVHWEGLDEDISVRGLLEGRGDMRRGKLVAGEVDKDASIKAVEPVEMGATPA